MKCVQHRSPHTLPALPCAPRIVRTARVIGRAAKSDDSQYYARASAPAEPSSGYEGIADTSVRTVYASAPPPAAQPILGRVGPGALFAIGLVGGLTFLYSVGKYIYNYNLPKNRSRRKLLKNKDVVSILAELLPNQRENVTPGMLRTMRFTTGFTAVEIFRKFLWYVLRDRQFNNETLDDLLHLKDALELSDDDVATALKERSVRIEKKYGNLMLQTAGMTQEGVLKKATCRALFSKMLFLVQNDRVLSPDNEVFNLDELRNIFGATEEDIEKLRIISLEEVDLDVLDKMMKEDQQREE